MMQNKTITICACVSRAFMDKSRLVHTAALLDKSGYSVTIRPDLCKDVMDAFNNKTLDGLGEVLDSTIIACHPRAVRSLFNMLDIPFNEDRIFDIRNHDVDALLTQMNQTPCEEDADKVKTYQDLIDGFSRESGTDAWFPVIDQNRCVNCGKCHDFCLFGVYDMSEKKVRVAQPHHCKNNCPACARMCPSNAIIFPKYEYSPINGGTINEETVSPDMKAMYAEELRKRMMRRKAGFVLLKD